ncbi:MAG: hypothetical protein QM696_10295 [Steroidobacteraceae bacterium]
MNGMPAALRALLLELFGEAIDEVRIVEHSLFNTLHLRPLAVTRRNRIYLRGCREEFFADPELVVHEYFHVLRQWATGELTLWRYVVELFRNGYWQNRFEVDARRFAAQHRPRYARLLFEGSRSDQQ